MVKMRNGKGRGTPALEEPGCRCMLGLQDGPEAPLLAPPSVRTQNLAVRGTMLYLLTTQCMVLSKHIHYHTLSVTSFHSSVKLRLHSTNRWETEAQSSREVWQSNFSSTHFLWASRQIQCILDPHRKPERAWSSLFPILSPSMHHPRSVHLQLG